MDWNTPCFSKKDMLIAVMGMGIMSTIAIFSFSGSWTDGDEFKKLLTGVSGVLLEGAIAYQLLWKKKLSSTGTSKPEP